LKKWFRPALLVHATIVAGLFVLLLFLAWTHPDDPPDANIGAGMVALLLGLFGLPWSFLATRSKAIPGPSRCSPGQPSSISGCMASSRQDSDVKDPSPSNARLGTPARTLCNTLYTTQLDRRERSSSRLGVLDWVGIARRPTSLASGACPAISLPGLVEEQCVQPPP
jgi:hypothetical protein